MEVIVLHKKTNRAHYSVCARSWDCLLKIMSIHQAKHGMLLSQSNEGNSCPINNGKIYFLKIEFKSL